MKNLRYLALLPLVAAAAHAYTIEFELGKSNPSSLDNSSVVGLDFATSIGSSDFELGLNLTSFDVSTSAVGASSSARDASIDLTYNLNSSKGGIRPYVGVGLGYAWFSNNSSSNVANFTGSALTTAAFAGVRFVLSDTVDLNLQFRNVELLDAHTVGNGKHTVNDWQSFAGIRLKF
jgi:outer membrane protein W